MNHINIIQENWRGSHKDVLPGDGDSNATARGNTIRPWWCWDIASIAVTGPCRIEWFGRCIYSSDPCTYLLIVITSLSDTHACFSWQLVKKDKLSYTINTVQGREYKKPHHPGMRQYYLWRSRSRARWGWEGWRLSLVRGIWTPFGWRSRYRLPSCLPEVWEHRPTNKQHPMHGSVIILQPIYARICNNRPLLSTCINTWN